MQPVHVLIARNPRAGARDSRAAVQQLSAALLRCGLQPHEFTVIEELLEHERRLRSEGKLRCVVSAGGDGTVALLTNCLAPEVPIAILPLGTENLLANYLGLQRFATRPAELAELIARGSTVRLDAGRVNGRLFLLMVGCGFDAEVVRRVHEQRRGHIVRLSYARPIVEAIRTYRYPELRIYCDPLVATGERTGPVCMSARWAFVFNLPRYAAGLRIAPDASGTDGLLDVCTFRQGSLWHGMRYLTGVLAGWHRGWPDHQVSQSHRIRIECDEPVPYQCDGDPGGMLPADIEILPGRLHLVVSPRWAQTYGASTLPDPAHQSCQPQ